MGNIVFLHCRPILQCNSFDYLSCKFHSVNNLCHIVSMKQLLTPLLVLSLALVTPALTHASPTDGYVQYANTFSIQNWTSGCGGYTNLGGGEYEVWVCAGESRVEMRWSNWPNQNTYNQFEFDEMFSPQSQNTAVHQIKSNTGGEVIYLQIQSPGTLRNDNGSVFATGMAGAWYHVNSMFNPVTGDAHCYINGVLQVNRNYPTTDRQWYFKCGAYNNGLPTGGMTTVWMKNFTNWVYLTTPPTAPTGLTAQAGAGQVALQWNPDFGCTNYFVQRSTTSGGPYTVIASVIGTTNSNFEDTAVVNGTTYYYVVAAANTFGQGPNSGQVSATPIDLGFQISASPPVATVNVGNSTNFTVTMTTNSSFNGTVTFGLAGLPSGASAGFSPPTLSAAGTTTLTINATTNAPGGSYALTIAGTNNGFAVTAPATLVVNGIQAAAGPLFWTAGSGVDTNWSTALNWTNLAVAGNGPPGISNTVIIGNTGAGTTNVVNANTMINALWYPLLPPSGGTISQTTLINSNISLVVAGTTNITGSSFVTGNYSLLVGTNNSNGNASGSSVSVAITGSGGLLNVSNTAGVMAVAQFNSSGNHPTSASTRAVLDLSGLGTLVANVGQLQVGCMNNGSAGTLYLALSNQITLNLASPTYTTTAGQGLDVGFNNSNPGDPSYLYLGLANNLYVDTAIIGACKGLSGLVAFNPAIVNQAPTLVVRNINGVSPVTYWNIGDLLTSSSTANVETPRGTNDFTGGSVDLWANALTVAKTSGNASNPPGAAPGVAGVSSNRLVLGTLTFNGGKIVANNLTNGWQVPNMGTLSSDTAIGTVNVNGTATLVVSNNFILAAGVPGYYVSGNPTNTGVTALTNGYYGPGVNATNAFAQGTLNLNGGLVQALNLVGAGGISTLNLNSGTLDLQSLSPNPGSIANLTTLNVGANGVNDSALLANVAAASVSNAVVIAPNGMIAGNTTITSPGLTVNGAISPGNNFAGGMTNNGPVALGAGGRFVVTAQDALAGPGTGWGFLQVNGAVNVQSTAGNPFTVSVQTPNGPAANFDYHTNFDWVIATASGVVAGFVPADFTVDNSQFANDLAGGYFYVRTLGNSLVLSFTNNHPPVAASTTRYRTANTLTIPLSSLAALWSDPDGDPVILQGISSNSVAGINNVSTDGTNIYYTSPGAAYDSFTYTVQDVRTNPPAVYQADDTVQTATGVVNVVSQLPQLSCSALSENQLAFNGSNGMPYATYYVLASTNVASPLGVWTVVATNAFDASGNSSFTNLSTDGQPVQFYLMRMR